MKVTIYIKSSLAGPTVRDGRYAAVVEFIRKSGQPVIRKVEGAETKSTYHRLVLLALIEAIKILTVKCEIEVNTDCIFVEGQIERNSPAAWKRAEWKNSKGQEVKNRSLWEEYLQVAEGHTIKMVCEKRNRYTNTLQKMINENATPTQ